MKIRKSLVALTITAVAAMTAACGGTGSSGSGGGTTLTVYSADGLGTWYKSQFAKFTKDTGINVNVVEAGSGEVVSRVEKEQANPQADLLVTLPPFIQKADKSGLLQPSGVDTAGISADLIGPGGNYLPIVNNALSFIVNPGANPQPETWEDLLKPEFKGKVQYSTPGRPVTEPRCWCCCSTSWASRPPWTIWASFRSTTSDRRRPPESCSPR